MSRYVDADEFEKRIKPYDTNDPVDKAMYNFAHNKMMDTSTADVMKKELYDRLLENANIIAKALNKYQTADMVEVVRCKDCKHYQFADNRAFGMPVKMCEWFGFEDVDDDEFCSRAERR